MNTKAIRWIPRSLHLFAKNINHCCGTGNSCHRKLSTAFRTNQKLEEAYQAIINAIRLQNHKWLLRFSSSINHELLDVVSSALPAFGCLIQLRNYLILAAGKTAVCQSNSNLPLFKISCSSFLLQSPPLLIWPRFVKCCQTHFCWGYLNREK